MLFTKIRLDGRTNIDLPFFGLRSSNRYILKGADGLGPPEVDVNIEDNQYLGRQPQDREIVIRVGLNPEFSIGETASTLRTELYGLLTPGASDLMIVKLMNGSTIQAQTTGSVKKIEIVPFSKDPEVQITVGCTGPYLTAPSSITSVPTKQTAENDTFTVDNIGSVTTGFFLEVTFTSNRSWFALYSEQAGSGPRFYVNWDFLAGDMLRIDTRKGSKSIRNIRGGETTSIFRGVTGDSIWFGLHPGINTFWVSPVTFNWSRLLYTPQYWGI